MTGTCESCVHWQPLAYDEEDRREFGYGGIPTGDDGRWGVCQMVGEGAGVFRKDFEPEKIAKREAERTDPWRWECRLCGASGESPDRIESNAQADAHIAPGRPCGSGETRGAASAGRLLHVWTY